MFNVVLHCPSLGLLTLILCAADRLSVCGQLEPFCADRSIVNNHGLAIAGCACCRIILLGWRQARSCLIGVHGCRPRRTGCCWAGECKYPLASCECLVCVVCVCVFVCVCGVCVCVFVTEWTSKYSEYVECSPSLHLERRGAVGSLSECCLHLVSVLLPTGTVSSSSNSTYYISTGVFRCTTGRSTSAFFQKQFDRGTFSTSDRG
jgi:hypothetical protein